MSIVVYPLIFSRIPVPRIWGGRFIADIVQFEQGNDTQVLPYGELWLLSDRHEYQSTIVNGPLRGVTLNELWQQHSYDIFGIVSPNSAKFPLLIKIIDAAEDLSLQVHPKPEDLPYLEGAEAKTEMWYIIKATATAEILAGFTSHINEVSHKDFMSLLNYPDKLRAIVKVYSAVPNQYFFIPAGTIHAIGKGNLIFEIQQNSDTTYRISDWGRLDQNGQPRKLHIAESMQSLTFKDDQVLNGVADLNNMGVELTLTPPNPYFHTSIYRIQRSLKFNTYCRHQFITSIDGSIQIIFKNQQYIVSAFTTILLPIGYEYEIAPVDEQATLISYN